MQIYSIYLITNLVNDKKYVGITCTNPPKRRWWRHVESANRGSLVYLSRAIRKHGKENFKFEVICQSLDRQYSYQFLEPHFINYFHTFSKTGYNLTNGGEGSVGYRHNSQAINKMSKCKLGVTHKKSVRKIIAKKNRISHSLKWELIFPDGKILTITNLKQWCRETGYSQQCLGRVAAGKRSHHYGIKCRKIFQQTKIFSWKITKPNGEIEIVGNLSRWCKNLGLLSEGFRKVADGCCVNYYGHQCERIYGIDGNEDRKYNRPRSKIKI